MSRDWVVVGYPKPHIWNQRPQFVYSLYNFYGATTTIKGIYMGAPHCKAVFGRKFPVKKSRKSPPVKIGPKMAVFRELRGVNVKFLFSNPEKAHP